MSLGLFARYGLTRAAPGGGGGGATPVIEATASGGGTIAGSFNVSMPTGVTTGERLLILFRCSRGSGNTLVDTPSGWAKITPAYAGAFGEFAALSKISDGTEGATVTVTLNTNTGGAAWTVYRISGAADAEADVVEDASVADPPLVTPAWGSANTLWIAGYSHRRTDNSYTAPTNYANILRGESTGSSSSTANCSVASADRALAASSEQPGAFGFTGTVSQPRAITVAIRPA